MNPAVRRRSFREVHADDPDRYGPAFEAVRRLPCFARRYGAECPREPGNPTAHHLVPVSRGGKDRDGLLPVCPFHHRTLDGDVGRTLNDLLRELGITFEDLRTLALRYHREALLDARGEPGELFADVDYDLDF